jgi:hypothetical protein
MFYALISLFNLSYLYGLRFKAPEAPIILSLREVWLHVCLPVTNGLMLCTGTIYSKLPLHRLANATEQRLRSGCLCATYILA